MSTHTTTTPGTRIWKRFLILIPLVIVMAIVCHIHIRSVSSTYTAVTPPFDHELAFDSYGVDDVTFSNPGVVEVVSVEPGINGAACVTFRALKDGETEVVFGRKELSTYWNLSVRNGAVIEGGVNFAGWRAIHICTCVFLGVLSILFGSAVFELQGARWFDYEIVVCGGGFLFAFFQFLMFTMLLFRQSLRDFLDLMFQLTNMVDWFAVLAFIPMVILALFVSISNVSLIRHEGRRPVNFLGIAMSIVLVVVYWYWYNSIYLTISNGLSYVAWQIIDSLIALAISYGECLLLSIVICSTMAARLMPRQPMDYLVVLGCGIRKDGTPTPLLAGRVDKARTFDEACVREGAAPATFVPSGGQGPDEVMSEAQCMGAYLERNGVSPERIVLEDRSATTRQNMTFSREVIERHAGRDASELKVGFSTTNYHVFRGYVCAHQAGMVVEGMGAKTKAYFWPNAFLREFIGLLAAQWRGIILTFAILSTVYAFATYVITVI